MVEFGSVFSAVDSQTSGQAFMEGSEVLINLLRLFPHVTLNKPKVV